MLMTPISFSETTNCTLSEEFEHIKDWAIAKMVINMSKTKVLVFCRSHPSRFYINAFLLLITSDKLKSLSFLVLFF